MTVFVVEGHSASHPFSSEAGLDNAIREAVDQIVATLGSARGASTTATAPVGATAATGARASGDPASEQAAWDATRRSRKKADYEAFLATYPGGGFAVLARMRMAVPDGRVWDPVFAETIPPNDKRRVDNYFASNPRTAVSEVQRYNRKHNIYAPNQSAIRISSVQSFEVLDADQNGAIGKLAYIAGSQTWGTLDTHIYEMRWVANVLEITGHQKP